MAKRKTKASCAVDTKIAGAVVLIFFGALLLARNLGLIRDELAQFWPVLLVLLGLIGLSNGLSK